MKFEIGKYYQHSSGIHMHIVSTAKTTTYGWSLIGETNKGDLRPVGTDEDAAVNWEEVHEIKWLGKFAN